MYQITDNKKKMTSLLYKKRRRRRRISNFHFATEEKRKRRRCVDISLNDKAKAFRRARQIVREANARAKGAIFIWMKICSFLNQSDLTVLGLTSSSIRGICLRTIKLRTTAPISPIAPVEIVALAIEFLPWYRLMPHLTLSDGYNEIISLKIEKGFRVFLTKLPSICIGRPVKENEVRDIGCMHQQRNTACRAKKVVPKLCLCKPKELGRYKLCTKTKAIMRPTQYTITEEFTQGNVTLKRIRRPRYCDNPSWICGSTLLFMKQDYSRDLVLNAVRKLVKELLKQLKSAVLPKVKRDRLNNFRAWTKHLYGIDLYDFLKEKIVSLYPQTKDML